MGAFDVRMYLGCEDSDIGWRANLFGAEVGESQYKPVTCGDYVKGKFDAAFAYRQKTAAAP